MLAWVNDQIIGRKAEQDKHDDDDNSGTDSQTDENKGGKSAEKEEDEENEGTIILDATCAPQNIRFPTDTSLLNEAREKAEEIIDNLHEMGLIEGKKPRTYCEKARRKYNSSSKSREKTVKAICTTIHQQLGYLNRDLRIIDDYERRNPGCLQKLSGKKKKLLQVIRTLHAQQESIDVEFGTKVEMSVVDEFLRIEDLRWDAYNESTTLQQ